MPIKNNFNNNPPKHFQAPDHHVSLHPAPLPEKTHDFNVHEQDYFVCLSEPLILRRNLLEASKGTLVVIKGLYLIREIKTRKQEKLSALQKEVREMRLLMQKAEELLPKHSRGEASRLFPHMHEVKQAPPIKQEQRSATPTIKVVPALSEMDRLSKSITEIDSKLKNLPGKNNNVQAKKEEAQKAPAQTSQANQLTSELGKTLDDIQKRLKQM